MQCDWQTDEQTWTNYQNPLNECKSLNTVVLLLPICFIISFWRLIGCWANWAKRWPSSTPLARGLLMISLRTDLHVSQESNLGWRVSTDRKARGFKPAICRAFLTSCSDASWRRLNRAGLTATRVDNVPSAWASSSAIPWLPRIWLTIKDLGLRCDFLFCRFTTCNHFTCHYWCTTIIFRP
jgi:hypothetical protein